MPFLIIFIDSLPYRFLSRTDFMASLPGKYEITPGFGYSVNIDAELFAGLRPDDLGYFGEWNYAPEKTPDRKEKLLSRLGFVRRWSPLLDRALHYGLEWLGLRYANIPFESLSLFERTGTYLLSGEWGGENLLDGFHFQTTLPGLLSLPYGKRDRSSYRRAGDIIRKGGKRIFVFFPDLDGIAHRRGIQSSSYWEKVRWLDEACRRLTEDFLARHPKGKVALLSDHGMAEFEEKVDLGLEEKFGKPDPEKLVYFYDSLYLRVWFPDPSLKEEVRSFLEENKSGFVLSREERRSFGLADPSLGEIIFLLREGFAFSPNYFGTRLHRAYHGYHPRLKSQKSILLLNGPELKKKPVYSTDVYLALKTLIEENEP